MDKAKTNYLHRFLFFYVFALSFLVMFEWIFEKPLFFIYFKNEIQTKFTTAFFLFLSTFSLQLFYSNPKKYSLFANLVAVILLIFSVLNIFQKDFYIDNLILKDSFSSILSGRMSLVSSCFFIFYSIGILSLSFKKALWMNLFQNIFMIGFVLVFFNCISVVLMTLVGVEKNVFPQKMSILTAFSFLFLFYLLTPHFSNSGLKKILFGNSFGSKILRKSIPYVTIIPFLLGYIVLEIIERDILALSFSIILYTLILIVTAFISVYITSNNINKSYKLRKNIQRDLILKNEELSQFKYALDQIANIFIVDKNFIITYVNDNFCKISKFSREEIIGQTNAVIRSDHHSDDFFKEIFAILSSGQPWSGEIKNKAKDGTFFWTETSIVPLKNGESEIEEYITIKLDITKKKESEELLASSYVKKLEQKNIELEQFTYITSHDLQEPLSTISSFYEILNKDYSDKFDENAKQIFKFIKGASSRMSQLIKNLLDYSRLGYSEQLTETNINHIIKDVEADLSTLIFQKKATILYENLPSLKVFPTIMRLMFHNLLSNGIKFSKPTIAPIISISAVLKNNIWEFSIKDNGIGIADEHQKKIFAIFQRLHLKEDYGGVGIGLAHCQKIVSLHEGEIWVKSKPNEGSTFYFTIPNT